MTQNFNNTVPATQLSSVITRSDYLKISNAKACKDLALTGAYKFTVPEEVKDPFLSEEDKKKQNESRQVTVHNSKTDMIYSLGNSFSRQYLNEIKHQIESFSPISHKFFLIIQDQYFKIRKQQFIFSIDEYIRQNGYLDKKDIDNHRSQIEKFIPALAGLGVGYFKETKTRLKKNKKIEVISANFNFFQHLNYRNGQFDVELTNDFLKYICHSGYFYVPIEICRIDNRDYTTYQIALKLCDYKGCNNNKISIQKLLEAIPNIAPREERKQNKPKRYIQTPILNSLKEIKQIGVLQSYFFISSDKTTTHIYKAEQVEAMTYNRFENLFLIYHPKIIIQPNEKPKQITPKTTFTVACREEVSGD